MVHALIYEDSRVSLGITLLSFLPVVFGSLPSLWAVQSLVPGLPDTVSCGFPFVVLASTWPVIGWPFPPFLLDLGDRTNCRSKVLYLGWYPNPPIGSLARLHEMASSVYYPPLPEILARVTWELPMP